MSGREAAVLELVRVQLGAAAVSASDRLVEDLAAESVDIAAIVAALEERLGIVVAEESLPGIRTVGDLVRIAAGGDV